MSIFTCAMHGCWTRQLHMKWNLFQKKLLINNFYPIVPHVLEYMNIIIIQTKILPRHSKCTLPGPQTFHKIIDFWAIITNQRNLVATSFKYCLWCLQLYSLKITCILFCSWNYLKKLSRSTMMVNNLPDKSLSSNFFHF